MSQNSLPSGVWHPPIGIVQKVFSEKASAIARMRQKCVRNASEMRQNGSCLWGKEERSKMRQNCVKNAAKNARNTFWGEQLLDDTDPTPDPEKVRKKSEKPRKASLFRLFPDFSDSFLTFSGSGVGGSQTLRGRLFGVSGFLDSVDGRRDPNNCKQRGAQL